jgi:hypothetical protein
MIFHTMHAGNSCRGNTASLLGPTMTSAIHGFHISDISTLIPYTALHQTGPMERGPLRLEDLYEGCDMSLSTHSAYTQTHPMNDDPGYRCYPRLVIPSMVTDFGFPWWRSCVVQNTEMGMVDPPYALTVGDHRRASVEIKCLSAIGN